MNTTDTAKKHTLQLRWLRLKRHLRSVNDSTRALRDAARAQSVPAPALFPFDPSLDSLCRSSSVRSLAA